MNENELRRRELLEQTRSLYKDSATVPAVHPRYNNIYKELYTEKNTTKKSSFTARLATALILFVLFATIDYNQLEIGNYGSELVVNVISTDINIDAITAWFRK